MDKIKIAICDDDVKYIDILEKYLYKTTEIKVVYDSYQSGENLINAYRNNAKRYDVIFLDMEMKELGGIETANLIRESDEDVIIIFVTSHTKYMQESFKCLPFRFLVKPVEYDEFKEVFSDIRKKLSKNKKTYAFTSNKESYRIFCDDIIYFESRNHCVYIHTKDEIYTVYKSLSSVYKEVDNFVFKRVHSSYVINFKYVKKIGNDFILLYHSNEVIPVSRSYKKDVMTAFTNFTERNLVL